MEQQQVLTALLALGVPYVTEIFKRAYALIQASPNPTITHLKPILAGMLLTFLSNKTGLPIPTDMVHLTSDYTTNAVATGAVFGAVGNYLSGLSTALKSHIAPDSSLGKGISVVLGKY